MNSTTAILLGLLAVLCLVEAVFILEHRHRSDKEDKDIKEK